MKKRKTLILNINGANATEIFYTLIESFELSTRYLLLLTST